MNRPHVKAGYEMRDDMMDIATDLAAAERAALERPGMAEALTAARKTRTGRTVTGRMVAANFPPFHTLQEGSASSLKRGEPLQVVSGRTAAGRSMLVGDIAKLEQRLIAQGIESFAEGAPTYCGIPIIENRHLPPGKVYIVADHCSTASLIAELGDLLSLTGKKP